jgi:hypothetical protein
MLEARAGPGADELGGASSGLDDSSASPLSDLPAPGPTREERADWLELTALGRRRRSACLEDLAGALRRAAADRDAPDRDRRAEAAASDAFTELHDRRQACAGAHPFRMAGEVVEAGRTAVRAPYAFLLLLGAFGAGAGPPGLDGASLFEEVCAAAGASYLGGRRAGARALVFGAPRRHSPAGFRAAVDHLCDALGEGGGCRPRARLRHQRDSRLDLVVWRTFPDRRAGKLIAFGQCATGRGWPDKLEELQPRAFVALWLREPLAIEPLRLFFVPFRVDAERWEEASLRGGVLFDRCRIAALAGELDPDVRDRCAAWSRHVIRTRLRPG